MEKSLSPLFDGISPESRAAMKTCFDVREQRFRADEVIYDFAARRDIIGILAEGSDADIVVYDPAGEGIITAADQAYNMDYNPFEGFRTEGHIAQVYLRGKLAVDQGEILEDRGGQFIPRGKCEL